MSNYIGKIFTFESADYSNQVLSVSDNPANGTNVCLATKNGSLKQRWRVSTENGFKLETMSNTKFVLDRYVGAVNTNNADVWTNSSNNNDEQQVAFATVLGNIVTISMPLFNSLF